MPPKCTPQCTQPVYKQAIVRLVRGGVFESVRHLSSGMLGGARLSSPKVLSSVGDVLHPNEATPTSK